MRFELEGDRERREAARAAARPFVALALALMLGILLGREVGWPRAWLAAGAGLTAVGLVQLVRQHPKAARCWAMLAVVALGAAWLGLRQDFVARANVLEYVTADSQLAKVTGRVVSRPHLVSPVRGAFGTYSYADPATLVVLEVDHITRRGRSVFATGRLVVEVEKADPHLKRGMRIRAQGWLSRIEGPGNPGELNYRDILHGQGIAGRLTLPGSGNWERLEEAGGAGVAGWVRRERESLRSACRNALQLGMREGSPQLALLKTLLLGERGGGELDRARREFRLTGLSHLLSISGAHLGILLGLVWAVVRLWVARPRRAWLVLLVVLGLFLMVVPPRVPIVRAGIMAGLICLGQISGRRVPVVGMLALAATGVLLWRPADLFEPGFQLSFGVVLALVVFAQPVAQGLWPRPPLEEHAPTVGGRVGWWAMGYLAASLVAFLTALPVVAYHWRLVSPLAVWLTLMALPLVTLVLGLGYLKILAGVVSPSAALGVGHPLAWATEGLLGLVHEGSHWPAAALHLDQQPSLGWVIAVLAVTMAGFAGRFHRRRPAMAACLALLLGWTFLQQNPAAGRWLSGSDPAALRLRMFHVGDGSCYFMRWPGRDGPHTLMFDCGSRSYLDTGERSIVPTLRRMGVERIDTLIVSHPDLDHFSGVLALVDHVGVGRVLVTPQLLREAEDQPGRAVAYLVEQLRRRGLRPEPIERGWRRQRGRVAMRVLWPPPTLAPERDNEASLVLSMRVAGRRVLFSGDAEAPALAGMRAAGESLQADVAELPHHGSFDQDESRRWLEEVDPALVLQSTGPRRLWQDPWPAVLKPRKITRLITERRGMVTLTIERDGTMGWAGFQQPDRQAGVRANGEIER